MKDVKKWISNMNGGKGPKKGALHKALHVPEGKKIPKQKIVRAAESPGRLGRMARLAENFAKMRRR